jgi:molybdate transport system regulatory protein
MRNDRLKNDLHSDCQVKRRLVVGKRPCIHRGRKNHYTALGRLWIEGRDGAFLGYGRIALLERIKQDGSITGAAKSLNMSYRHAWDLIDSMNRQSRIPLVEKAVGGKGGGGTHLTEAGEKAIRFFRAMDDKFREFLDKEMDNFPL